jgi:hypothetical protein
VPELTRRGRAAGGCGRHDRPMIPPGGMRRQGRRGCVSQTR